MSCPMSPSDEIGGALMKCPFLAEVASRCGEGFARRFACKPAKWQGNEPQHRPVFEESITDFQTTLNLFHGPSGLVPVGRFAGGENVATPSHTPALQRASRCAEAEKPAFGGVGAALGTAAPFATISIPFFNFLPGPEQFFPRARKQRRKNRKSGNEHQPSKKPPPQQPNAAPGTSSGVKTAPRGTVKPASISRAPPPPPAGKCPLRNWPILGGLIPLSARGDLACPPAIVAMRAAVARLKPVRDLRPQALPVKLIAIGAAGLLANIPFGMWRAHLPKFSPGWFVAVHVTVPFIAVLRKAVVMPKWAIILTVAAAVAGQMVGTKVEHYRLACLALEAPQPAQAKKPVDGSVPLPQLCSQTSFKSQAGLFSLAHGFQQQHTAPWIHVA